MIDCEEGERSKPEKKMMEVMKRETSHGWWFDSHNKVSRRSPWLQSTLSELDAKTKAMLNLIEEDADSFAQRAEMYYKKRPELINMVEEFYRAHRSLAERYDFMKSDHGTRLLTAFGSPFMSIKLHKPKKLVSMVDQTYNSYSESSDAEEYAESEVEDPEQEGKFQIEKEIEEFEDPELVNEIAQVDEELKEAQVVEDSEQEDEIQVAPELKEDIAVSEAGIDELKKLMEEMETLKEENKKQKFQLEVAEESRKKCVPSEVYIDEIEKLSQEIETLREENQKQKVQLEVAEESKKDSVPKEVYIDEIEKLRVEIEKLRVVEDSEQEDEIQVAPEFKEDSAVSEAYIDEIKKLMEEMETLKEENKNQKFQLKVAEESRKDYVSKEVYIDEIEKLREEIETLREENKKQKVQLEVAEELKKDSVPREVYINQIEKLRVEMETLEEENKNQKDQLKQKDKEKIQVIRQLSMAVGVLKDENSRLRKHITTDALKKNCPVDFNKLKGSFLGKLFGRSPNSSATVSPT